MKSATRFIPRRSGSRIGRWLWRGALVLGLVLVALGLAVEWPVDAQAFPAHPNPTQSYTEAEQKIKAIQAQEAGRLNPLCQTQMLSHGQKTARVIVFVHGYTSCPQQFARLAEQFYQRGDNVLIMPMPRHGLTDRMTDALAGLTAEELTAYGDTVVDLAHGLGEHVTVVGISAGGALVGWLAQNRADIDQAVLISPAFGYAAVPSALTLPAMHLYLWLPNQFNWWDANLKEQIAGPAYAYPRFATRGLAENLRISLSVQAQARQRAPQTPAILVVTNANDTTVSRPIIDMMISLWQQAAPGHISTYEFPAEHKLPHDLIDPEQPDQNVAVVYPKLMELIAP